MLPEIGMHEAFGESHVTRSPQLLTNAAHDILKQLNCIGNIQMLMKLCDHSNQGIIFWEGQQHN